MEGQNLGNKYLIWDFDGTLAYRRGTWSECLRDAIIRALPRHEVMLDQIRPYLQAGFPWHTADRVHVGLQTADEWWDRLNPAFTRAFVAVGIDSAQAERSEGRYGRDWLEPEARSPTRRDACLLPKSAIRCATASLR